MEHFINKPVKRRQREKKKYVEKKNAPLLHI